MVIALIAMLRSLLSVDWALKAIEKGFADGAGGTDDCDNGILKRHGRGLRVGRRTGALENQKAPSDPAGPEGAR